MSEVLLVEDHDDTREALAEALTLYGYEVTAFRTGIHAVEYLGGHKPDVVVLDSALPWVDGEDVIRTMRTSARLRDVPAIVISADIRRIARARTLTPFVIAKPFDPSTLLQMLAKVLGREPANAPSESLSA